MTKFCPIINAKCAESGCALWMDSCAIYVIAINLRILAVDTRIAQPRG